MNKKIKIKKLYTGLSEEQVKTKNTLNLLCSITVCAAAVIVPCLPMQTGIKELYERFGFIVYSAAMLLWFSHAIVAAYCLVNHFISYKIRQTVYENQKTALKGEWHTFAGLEIQLVLAALSLLSEAYFVVRRFDIQTLIATLATAVGFAAALCVRQTTKKAFSNLSEKAPSRSGENADEGGRDDGDESEITGDFYE
ncbi:MAG: hypothetical protein ACI4SC_02695 [Candidatus Neoclostridium sp.]